MKGKWLFELYQWSDYLVSRAQEIGKPFIKEEKNRELNV